MNFKTTLITELFILITLTLAVWYSISFLYKKIKEFFDKNEAQLSNKHLFLRIILEISEYPVKFVFIMISLEVLKFTLSSNDINAEKWHFEEIRKILICLCLLLVMFKVMSKIDDAVFRYFKINKDGKEVNFDKSTADIVSKAILILTIAVFGIIILEVLGFQIGAVFAFTGLSGILLGWCVKDFFASIISTVSLYFDKQFIVGNTVRLLDRFVQVEGVVEKIDWRITRIRTYDKRLVHIPNILFSTVPVENISMISSKRVVVYLSLFNFDNCTDIIKLQNDINAEFSKSKFVSNTEDTLFEVQNFQNSQIIIKISFYLKPIMLNGKLLNDGKMEITNIIIRICNKMVLSFNCKFE